MKIKINDKVIVIKGKDRGKSGKVIQVFPEREKIVVEGLNIIKKHMKSGRKGEKGQILELSAPLTVSNVMLICPKCSRQTRVRFKIELKEKKRQCKKCGELAE